MDEIKSTDNNLIGMTEDILLETRTDISEKETISIPIAELATLGVGISSLMPKFRTITQTASINTQGLYTLSNSAVGDVLKASKDGSFWGALKTSEGTSKMAKFRSVDPITSQSTVTMPFNPAMIMIAAALYSIDKKLGNIEKTTKQILTFLEVEKESEIEADVETLMSIISKYKMNWENEQFRTTNHKLVLDIQRTARKNMISYQKEVNEMIRATQIITIQSKVRAQLKDIQKKYKYYRLSLYSFSLASMLEIMLSGNYKEEYVLGIKNEINNLSEQYRNLFEKCSLYLEQMSGVAVEKNILKGVGTASNVVGKFVGGIPIINKGSVDEFLQDGGAHLRKNATGNEEKVIREFATVSDPGVSIFVNQMETMIQIYNHTSSISFDTEKIYLISE